MNPRIVERETQPAAQLGSQQIADRADQGEDGEEGARRRSSVKLTVSPLRAHAVDAHRAIVVDVIEEERHILAQPERLHRLGIVPIQHDVRHA